jgi:hypothetical protein
MHKIANFLKSLQIGRVLTVLLAAAVLFVTTACSTGNEMGARPDNPSVQMGGQNNPYKMGGDGYTKYKMSTDPAAHRGDQSSLTLDQLVAVAEPNGADGLLYPGSGKARSADSVNDFVSPERQAQLRDPGQIPAKPQPSINRSDPDAKLLERVGQSFKDASQFLQEGTKVIDEPHRSNG